MATISSVLTLNDKMSTTFSSITKAMHSTLQAMKSIDGGAASNSKVFEKASQDILEAENNLNSYNKELQTLHSNSNKATSSTNSFLKSLLGFKAVQSIFNLVNNQMGSAISRIDTMNNFPKVMSNLGISTEQSEIAINRLSEGLKGIPTTLDSAVMAVQRFTSANNNVGYSTDMFLALNNALLAGGSSADIQSSALEQLSQAYAKGKPDMMEWRTLQSAMPAQLQQIATAMGTTSTALGEGLRKGTISMNDFMNTIMKLNKEGANGFPSLEEQARNATGGIQTSIANMKSAITRGVSGMITNINESLENAGLGNISTIINNFGKTIENVLSTTGQKIGMIINMLTPVFNLIQSIYNFLQNNWGTIAPIILGIASAIAVYKIQTKLLTPAIKAVTNVTKIWTTTQKALNFVLAMNPLTLIIIAIISVIAAISATIVAVEKAKGNTVSAIGTIMGVVFSLGAFIWNVFIMPVWNMIAALVNFVANCFKDPVTSVKILFAEMGLSILQMVNNVVNAAIEMINKIPFVEIGVDTGLNNLVGNLESKIQSMKDSMGWEDVMQKGKTIDYSKAYNSGYGVGTKITGSVSKAISNVTGLDNKLNDIIGTDGSGGKAVKTTSNDDLLSDEDIKLLLDVATRDYKLNYQHVTPQITMTFGDIRETADVDSVIDRVADKLEEIYDSDLEVVRA